MPGISVVIPTYNRSRYLVQAIRSVLAQTYQDFEVIVIDDGSTDDTPAVVEGLADARICYFRQENKGISAARNAGIARAQAELIAFLDSDDVWYPAKLDVQLKALGRHPNAGLVFCSCHTIGSNNEFPYPQQFLLPEPAEWVGNMHKDLFTVGRFATPAVVVRRRLLMETGGFDESMPFAEDWDLWLRLSRISDFCNVGQVLIGVRRHEENTTWDLPGTLRSDLDLIRRYLPDPLSEPDRLIRCRSEMISYASHGLRGLSLAIPEAAGWLRECQARGAAIGDNQAVGELLTGLLTGKTVYSMGEIERHARVLRKAVEVACSFGCTSSPRDCVREFLAGWVHICYGLKDYPMALRCARRLVAECGIGAADRGVRSIAVRSALKVVTSPARKRTMFPVEKDPPWLRGSAHRVEARV